MDQWREDERTVVPSLPLHRMTGREEEETDAYVTDDDDDEERVEEREEEKEDVRDMGVESADFLK